MTERIRVLAFLIPAAGGFIFGESRSFGMSRLQLLLIQFMLFVLWGVAVGLRELPVDRRHRFIWAGLLTFGYATSLTVLIRGLLLGRPLLTPILLIAATTLLGWIIRPKGGAS